MLTQLTVNNFAIVKFLELDLQPGMTCITGETGAGKSIAIDALGLCLGERAEASMVRPASDKSEVSARFLLDNNPAARAWLTTNELENEGECIVRRVISAEGRSRSYINSVPVPLTQLKQLGQLLSTSTVSMLTRCCSNPIINSPCSMAMRATICCSMKYANTTNCGANCKMS